MKKLFLFSVLALGAMTMSAQIQLEHTLDGIFILSPETAEVHISEIPEQYNIVNQYYCIHENNKYSFYYNDFTLATFFSKDSIYLLSTNIFTTDGKITYIEARKGEYDYHLPFNSVKLYNEDGSMLFDFGANQWFGIFNKGGEYKFYTTNYDVVYKEGSWDYILENRVTKIYSLPGNGQPTDLETPSAPARTTNARKVVENGQMYIILDGVKYAVTGSSM